MAISDQGILDDPRRRIQWFAGQTDPLEPGDFVRVLDGRLFERQMTRVIIAVDPDGEPVTLQLNLYDSAIGSPPGAGFVAGIIESSRSSREPILKAAPGNAAALLIQNPSGNSNTHTYNWHVKFSATT